MTLEAQINFSYNDFASKFPILIEDEIQIDDDVIWACADDHCQFACIEGEVNVEIGMSLILTFVLYTLIPIDT